VWNLPGVFLDAKRRRREAYEQIRVLYVAMTRPRTQLVVSCAEKNQRGGESLFSLLDDATGGLLAHATSAAVPCGSGEITVESPIESLEARQNRGAAMELEADTSDWSSYGADWRSRWDRHEKLQEVPLYLTPTGLKAEQEQPTTESQHRHAGTLARDAALVLGEVSHRILENWNFQTQSIQADLDRALARHISSVSEEQQRLVEDEVRTLWATFTISPAYRELQCAHILGREMPFILPWDQQIMEGVIDVLYELNGKLYVADYKTDHVRADELDRVRENYQDQAEIYTEAVKRSLGREVAGFRLVLLRLGRMV